MGKGKVADSQHEMPEPFLRRPLLQLGFGRDLAGVFLVPVLNEAANEIAAVGEVMIEAALRHAERLSNILDTYPGWALGREKRQRSFEPRLL